MTGKNPQDQEEMQGQVQQLLVPILGTGTGTEAWGRGTETRAAAQHQEGQGNGASCIKVSLQTTIMW